MNKQQMSRRNPNQGYSNNQRPQQRYSQEQRYGYSNQQDYYDDYYGQDNYDGSYYGQDGYYDNQDDYYGQDGYHQDDYYSQDGYYSRDEYYNQPRQVTPQSKGKGKKPKKKKKSDYIMLGIVVICITAILVSGYQLFKTFREYKIASDEYDKIAEQVVKPPTDTVDESNAKPEGTEHKKKKKLKAPISIDFASLEATNPDIVGWIHVEGLDGVSYPIVQGDTNDKYLHTTFQGTYNFAGSIFMDCQNRSDFGDCTTVVYGHNMKDGSMFGRLKWFETQNSYSVSPYIWVLTPTETMKYEIFASYETPVNSSTYTLFRRPSKEFLKYCNEMKSLSAIKTNDVTLDARSKILTLSTCTGNEETRYVIQAVRVYE